MKGVSVEYRHIMLAAGTRLGSYEILAPIGAGGMGEVYRSREADIWIVERK